jgi:DNA repair protein RadC
MKIPVSCNSYTVNYRPKTVFIQFLKVIFMSYSVKDLPKNEQPREKLIKNGVNSLSNVELLSILLRTGISGKNVKELSAEILDSYPVYSLSKRSIEDLKDFRGISDVKATQLKALGELALRMQNESKEKINSFSDLKDRLQDMKYLEKEKVRLFMLSSGNKLLYEEDLEGEVSSVSFKPQKIFRLALKNNASAIIVAHNHPSGRDEPTQKDIETTEDLVETGSKLGIELLDHVIIGKNARSMRRNSTVKF